MGTLEFDRAVRHSTEMESAMWAAKARAMGAESARDAYRRRLEGLRGYLDLIARGCTPSFEARCVAKTALLADDMAMPCGHHPASVASSDEGTNYCAACKNELDQVDK